MTSQAQRAEFSRASRRSYGQILKSSAIIGGASALNIAFGIVRTKVMALLLGPAGVGLFGLFSSVHDIVRSLAGMGINNSGVRQIAEALGSGDTVRIARTVTTLRRVAFWTGALGGLLLLVLCRPLSRLTFGDERYTGALAVLGLAVFFADVSAGQAALLQGLRRIADLARLNVLGAGYGTLLSIPLIYFFRERGIVPSLVAVAGMSILTSWWYARQVRVARVAMSWREMAGETSALLRLGFVFMATGLMTMGVAYLVRLLLVRQLSLADAGYYQAAWVLGGLYFGFILQAMGADFYPRLTAVARNNAECSRLVNEQAEVGLLLAVPGVLGTLALAPLVIELFYSQKFGPAVGILRWICLGMLLRVACWPLGFILLAKAQGTLFFWTELMANALQLSLIWAGVKFFGLAGTGIGFFALYVVYGLGIYLVVRRVAGFRWSIANRQLALFFVPLVAAVFAGDYLLPRPGAVLLGLLATVLTGFYSLRTLCALIPLDRLPRPVRAVCQSLRLAPTEDNQMPHSSGVEPLNPSANGVAPLPETDRNLDCSSETRSPHPWWILPRPSRTAILFLLLVPLFAHLLFSWMGLNPTDDGFFLGMGRRILDGEVPHRDFITARPAGVGLLWAPLIVVGGDYTIWLARFFVWFQFACIGWIWTAVLSRMLGLALRPVEQVALALAAFALTAHTFVLAPFPAIDGLWFASLGLLACVSSKPSAKLLGYFLVGLAGLSKQNFLALGPAFLVLLGDWRKLRYWPAWVAPVCGYAAALWLTRGFADFRAQLTSHTELMHAGAYQYIVSRCVCLGLVAGFCGWLVVSGRLRLKQFNLSARARCWLLALGSTAVLIPPALCLLVSWNASQQYSLVLFGLIAGTLVYFVYQRSVAPEVAKVALLVLALMWTVSISTGCNFPVLGSGAAVVLLACGLRRLLPADTVQARFSSLYRSGLVACALITLLCFGVGRSWHIYMERPAWELRCSLGGVLPGGKLIRTNPATFQYMKELRELTDHLNGRQYAVLPDAAIYWVKAPQKNPLPTSWPLDFELGTPELFDRFIGAVEACRGQTTFLVAKTRGFSLVGQRAPDWYKIVPYIQEHFHKTGETQYWEVYE